jgi:transcription termination/antitermination protein NusA
MDPKQVLLIVEAIHRDKNIEKEIVFEGIEAALITAAKKHYGDAEEIEIHINREDGSITGTRAGEAIDPTEMAERIGAQTAKQIMIQKIREAERDAVYEDYIQRHDHIISGVIHKQLSGGGRDRADRDVGRTAIVTLGNNLEAILPRGEQIPRERFRVNDRVRAVVSEVQKAGSRVKIILSRTRPAFVQRLFEQEIPEINEGIIEIKAVAREPGYRTKIAVTSSDQRIDCVGACVGVRGARIRTIGQELSEERIDIVRWDEDLLEFIPNALQPAEVEEVILCEMLGRAICLVREDQTSLAIGRKGQNVRLASKLCGWDIDIMTRDQLETRLEAALVGFIEIEGVSDELADRLIGEGFLTFDDLSIIEPDALMEMGELTLQQVDAIVEKAEELAELEEERERQEKEESKRAAYEAEFGRKNVPQATPVAEVEPAPVVGSVETADAAPEAETQVEPEVKAPVEEEAPVENAESPESEAEETPDVES